MLFLNLQQGAFCMNLTGYGILFIFVILSLLFAVAMLVTAYIVQPKYKREIKFQTYECGLNPNQSARIKFDAKYYIFAILFLLFDVETIFLFPWAVIYNKIGLFALLEGILFILVLGIGLFYAIKRKLLEWQ